MPKLRKVLIAGIPALLAAVIGAGAVIYAHQTTDKSDSRGGVSVDQGSGNCINVGNQATVNCSSNTKDSTPYDLNEPPTGPGPWAFRVWDTVVDGVDLGLTVRSCPFQQCGCQTANCEKVGIARNGSILFALCHLDSGFNGNDTTTDWLKIKWPSQTAGDYESHTSSRQDAYLGWVLKKYTTPAGHNGEIQACG